MVGVARQISLSRIGSLSRRCRKCTALSRRPTTAPRWGSDLGEGGLSCCVDRRWISTFIDVRRSIDTINPLQYLKPGGLQLLNPNVYVAYFFFNFHH